MRDQTKTNTHLLEKISVLEKKIKKLEKAQVKLRESEARYRTIIENIHDGYMEVDLAGKYIFINDMIPRHLGYTREELIGMSISKILNEASSSETTQIFNQVYKTGKPCKPFEVECIRKDGSRGIYELSISLIRDARGEPVGFRSISRDITERKTMENALRESENRYRMIVENMHESIWTMDMNLNYTYLSPSEFRISGYTAEEAARLPLDKLITPESLTSAMKILAEELERESSGMSIDPHRERIFELELYHKTGNTLWQETTGSFMRDDNGKPIGILFVGRNVTKRKQAERELQLTRNQLLEAEKLAAIGQLSAGVAHEILNPVNIISLELQLIQAMKSIPEEIREELDICLSQIDRIVAIADGLKQLARVHEKKMNKENINEVVAQIITLCKTQLMIDKIETDVQYQKDLPEIQMDRKRIEQVLMNLISNARGAMEGQQTKVLRITTGWENNKQVRIMVADTGSGIQDEHLLQVFNPFFTTKEQGKGTGLGLSISYGIMKDHGGRIYAENNEWGGASFYVTLPAQPDINKSIS
ncbi:MAG: PAS domain S-box protein [Syntrophaceae bacterium]|nr:PAS domain S-box protein [Syntrophaceae bacterium]